MEIWINPACSKCRSAKAELDAAGIDLPRDAAHRDEWIAAMVADPRTIQRPIITAADGTTVVGRDAASIEDVIAHERG
ncbi:MAG: arsenate reductase related protein [Marmoricola sp.]|nr:arsenate reductase related protein [Marmoricola sp.]